MLKRGGKLGQGVGAFKRGLEPLYELFIVKTGAEATC